jgi:squalene-hopene/tetraprenyl-beta-curcumene cyclase
MSQSATIQIGRPGNVGHASDDTLLHRVEQALWLSVKHSIEQMHTDGHWCGELRTNVTTVAEHIFLYQALGIDLKADREAFISWFRYTQGIDGGWGIFPDHASDISVTVEAYLALKILGVSVNDEAMCKARGFAISVGGAAKVRIFTRIYLAMFGLFPWNAIPEIPAELILLPPKLPISIYHWSAWARATVVPLLVILHHRPVYALPSSETTCNEYLDELWCNPREKRIPYTHDLSTLLRSDPVALVFTLADFILHRLNGLRSFNPIRHFALQKCVRWILQHQEDMGDIGDIMPPLHGAMLALSLEGYPLHADPMRRGLEAIERFAWRDEHGKRIQTTVSAFWDTSLMLIALADAGTRSDKSWLVGSLSWLRGRQLFNTGDWRMNNHGLNPGGFSFGYFNTWYPDMDDTASAVLAMIRQDARLIHSSSVLQALNWLLGMQNKDGGWGAFDRDNHNLYLNKIPFSDMGGLCDPSSPDVSGHVLEALGVFLAVNLRQKSQNTAKALMDRVVSASRRAIYYLSAAQEPSGAWYGRWGCNYIYGTSAALCGLAYFIGSKKRKSKDCYERDDSIAEDVSQAIEWLASVQNQDGGWGETIASYRDPVHAGCGPSTASQTAWALMGLIPYMPASTESIRRGVEYLVQTQIKTGSEGATWHERSYTGTGFPNHLYIGYSFYPHYFPMMALGRYARATQGLSFDWDDGLLT